MIKRILMTAIALLAIVGGNMKAQEWIDVTSAFIVNPRFDTGNSNGWYVGIPCLNGGYQANTYNNYYAGVYISNFVEAWYPSSNLGEGEISQQTTLPKGKYCFSADGIAVNQNKPDAEPMGSYLFVRTENDGKLYTTPMASANGKPEHFELTFEVAEETLATIGIMTASFNNINWLAADNFKIEIDYNDFIPVEGFAFTAEEIKLYPGESKQLELVFKPKNATMKNAWFYSEDDYIATIDANGVVTAKEEGETLIVAFDKDGNEAVCRVSVEVGQYIEGALAINEIQASNVDFVMDPSWNYGSWIELYNSADEPCGIAGLYITDDPANLKKQRLSAYVTPVPAHGHKNIWFDHYGIWGKGELTQVNFKLNYDGGTIIISDGETVLLRQDYPQAVGRASYARTTDGGAEWVMSPTPTPEESNDGMAFATEQLPVPVVNLDGQFFDGELDVEVAIADGATLRYTTDGSTPTLYNGETSTDGRFTIDGSTVFRFRAFKDGYLPSEVATRSYLRGESNRNLAVISVVTDQRNIYSRDYGLFEKGPNGRAGNGQDEKCNWNMSWDRPVNFEYITEDSEYALSQEVDMSMCGGWSRAWTPHSFKLKAAKYYQGKNSMNYQFFDNKPFLKHKTLQIRNGGNNGLLKDASLQEIMRRSGLDIETQSWKPVNVYLNGTFYAQLNMREPNNKHYGSANYGIDTDEMDQFEMSPDSGYVQMTGTKDAFNQLYNLSANAGNPDTYEEIGKLLDIDEFINYYAAEVFLGGNDWLRNNVKAFRDRNGGKFRFVVFDTDAAFSGMTISDYKNLRLRYFDTLRGEDALGNSYWGQNIYAEIEIITIFENLLKNKDFRRKFVDALCVIGGSTFHPDFAEPIINEMASKMNVWRDNPIDNLRYRQSSVASQLTSGVYDFGVNKSQAFTTTLSSNVDGAGIYVNDMPVPTGRFSGTLYQPVTIKAIAPAGYRFKGWKKADGSISANDIVNTIFDKGATWSFYDEAGGLDGEDWKTAEYASSWPAGPSPIGYDKDDNPKGLSTWVTNKILPTYYFSKNFNIDSKTDDDRFWIDFRVDDGMVIYINGEEALRHNMRSGEITYNSFAVTWADDQCDYGRLELPNGLFRIGENTIAVEVHNNDGKSSDIHWNAALQQVTPGEQNIGGEIVSTDLEYSIPNVSGMNLVAEYEPIAKAELAQNGVFPVKVNEISASNSIYVNDYFKKDDWIELYNTTGKPIDVAGMYISDDEAAPQKFQIPANDMQQTVIEPHGHLVVWASKRSNTGSQIHTNFKLGNSNGESVVLTSEDGSWSDVLAYDAHGERETVGLYPDGGNDVYKMSRPTIGRENALTSYAQYLYTNTYEPAGEDDFTLNLTEGWNWISHPLERSIAASEIRANAQMILSQTQETANLDGNGWNGSLASLEPGRGYKVMMSADDSFTFDGPFYKPAYGLYLRRGWNWIGYTQPGSQSLAAAMAGFAAEEGDKIIGRSGFATFENGTWSGSLETLAAGQGYMFKSAEPKSLTFTASAGNRAAAPRFHAQPRTPWSVADAQYPDVMGMVASVVCDGVERDDLAFSVGAFGDDGQCRGIGKYIDGRLFVTIFGNAGDMIEFKATDATTGIVYDIAEQFHFTSDVVGSRRNPVALHIGEATDIDATVDGAAAGRVAYYTVGGAYAGSAKSALGKGLYVKKCVLGDGTVIAKKIAIQ